MKLSYAITTHNEYDEINELLGLLIHHIDKDDEICILDDYSDERTQEVFKSWVQQYGDKVNIKIKDLNRYFYFLKTLPQLKHSKIIPTDTMRMSMTELI